MRRAILWGMLLFLPVRWVCGQSAEPMAPIFPSDGKPPDEANGAELLEAVCPGQVEVGERIGCGKACPSFTGVGKFGDGGSWSLSRVMRGHFLSSASDDAILSVEGCEPHSENFGGTILLTRDLRGWAMDWYKAGVETSQCHKIPLRTGREILLCIGTYGGQGNVWTDLYVEDLLNPGGNLMAEVDPPFFTAFDNILTCGYNHEDPTTTEPLTRAFIEEVQLSQNPPGAEPTVSVTASFERASTTPETTLICIKSADKSTFAPPVKSYHLDFVFDGHDYKPTAASAETARMFESR